MAENVLGTTIAEARFEQVLADILRNEEDGTPIDLAQAVETYPDLESSLREYYRNRAGFDRLAPSLAPRLVLPDLPPDSRIDGYEIVEEIDRGGRGIVYRVRDAELNRSLAVKLLLPELRDDADAVRRFLEERQVTGQLQHPGIVPVHSVGNLPDGRPYFAMKLVQGRTLAALLAERFGTASPQRKQESDAASLEDSAEPTQVDLSRFLGIFQQICQAVAYAHSLGVIHRDLKTKNVMVGAFAEVQVMDWGLSKVLGVPPSRCTRLPSNDAEKIHTVRTDNTGFSSSDGTVAGTYAYMSPEQANGLVDQIDERADAFGLGAMLCEILTSLPPYRGASAWEVHQEAAAGHLADAFNRLESCGADAELIALAKDCLAIDRDARPRNAGVVAERLATYSATVADRLRRAELERAAAEARQMEVEEKLRAECRARRLAVGLIAATLMIVLTGAGGLLWVQHVKDQRKADQAQQAQDQRHAVESILERAAVLQKEARWKEAKAVLDQAQERLGESGPEDLAGQVQRSKANLDLVARLDSIRMRSSPWENRRNNLLAADKDYAAVFREAGLGEDTESAETLAARVRASDIREELIAVLDEWATVAQSPKRQDWLMEVARHADPDPWGDRFRDPKARRDRKALEELIAELLHDEAKLEKLKPRSLSALGAAIQRMNGDPTSFLTAALALHPDDFRLNLLMADALHKFDRFQEADSYYLAALTIRPQSAVAHNSLGAVLSMKKLEERAIRHFRKAIELDPRYPNPHGNLAYMYLDKGQLGEAMSEFQTALELDSENPRAHNGLGMVLVQKKQVDAAIREFRRAIELDSKAAVPHALLGGVFISKKQLVEAIQEFQKAVDLEPRDPSVHRQLAIALSENKQQDKALLEFQAAVRVDPRSPVDRFNLGNAFYATKKFESAIPEYRAALLLDPDYADAHSNLSATYHAIGRIDDAISEIRAAVKLQPKNAYFRHNLGYALRVGKQLKEAVTEFQEAIKIDQKYAKAHGELGLTLYQLGRFAEARDAFRKCLELLPEGDPMRAPAINELKRCEDALAKSAPGSK
jgi:serine/threonine-protein kinase